MAPVFYTNNWALQNRTNEIPDQGLKQLEDYLNSTTYLQNIVNEL